MKRVGLILLASVSSAAWTLRAGEPEKALAPAPAAFALWDGKEGVADYARRVGLEPVLTLDLNVNVKLELVLVPAGKFVMGSPKDEQDRDYDETQHEVTLTRPFYLGKCEVTQEQYEALAGRHSVSKLEKNPRRPVTAVSWEDAVLFGLKLGQQARREARLPTEAEWEFACRAGTQTPFYAGASEEDLARAAWYRANCALGSKTEGTHLVGEKTPNAFGLCDMHGNVFEWCQDTYEEYPAAAVVDPRGPAQGFGRVARGGSWLKEAGACRAANREWFRSTDRVGQLGFRVVVNVAPRR